MAASRTFKTVAAEWRTQGPGAKRGAATQEKHTWLLGLLYKLDNVPVHEIEPADVLTCLRPIEAKGHNETAHRALTLANRVMRYAVASGYAVRDPCADLRNALQPIKQQSHAAIIDPPQLRNLLQAIWLYHGQPATLAALKLSAFTFLRSGELRGGVWREID
jgi:integrase